MKKILCFILSAAVLGFLINACKPKVDIEKEKEAIKSVIEAETQAYVDKNSAAFKDLYIQDEDQLRAVLNGSDLNCIKGWSKFSWTDSLKYLDLKDVKFKHDFIAIKVLDKFAWAVLTADWYSVTNGVPGWSRDLQTITLEKGDGKWKISCFVIATMPPSPPPPPPPAEKDKK